MKNLKKVLCLALAFAMVLGLVVVGSAAQDVTTLADWDEVTDKNSATLLNAFNIMQGDDEGFRPNDNVKRTEAAKMLSVALWGGNDDVKLYSGNNIGGYTDVVAGSWYMGYVNYMTVQGIMAGDYGTTNFRPNGNVTGYELLKMCLVALGYNPETEGLTGAGWDIRTMAHATNPSFRNLTSGTKVANWNEPLNRMNAATIIANMVLRQTVQYDLQTGVAGNISAQLKGKVDKDGNEIIFGTEYLKMTRQYGRLIANTYGSLAAEAKAVASNPIDVTSRGYYGQNALVDFGGETPEWITVSSTYEDLGHIVTKYVKTNVGTVYCSVNDANEIAPELKSVGGAVLMTNYKTAKYNAETDADGLFTGTYRWGKPATNLGVASNYTVKFLDTEATWSKASRDGYIDYVVPTRYEVVEIKGIKEVDEKNTVYQLTNATWSNTRWTKGTYTIGEDILIEANCDFTAAKGDFVAISVQSDAFGKEVVHGYVLESIEGKVTRTSTDTLTNGTTVYVDGVKYGADEAREVNDEGTFYLWADGRIAKFVAKEQKTETHYALIYNAGYDMVGSATTIANNTNTIVEVSAVLDNGTDKTFKVAKVGLKTDKNDANKIVMTAIAKIDGAVPDMFANKSTKKSDGLLLNLNNSKENNNTRVDNNDAINAIWMVSLNEDGTINLIQPCTQVALDTGDDKLITTGVPTVAATGNKFMTSKTVTFVQVNDDNDANGEKWVMYTGLTTPSYVVNPEQNAETAKLVVALDATGNATTNVAAMMIPKGSVAGNNVKSDYFYLVTKPEIAAKAADGTLTYEADVWSMSDNKLTTVQYKADGGDALGVAGSIYVSFDVEHGFGDSLFAAAEAESQKGDSAWSIGVGYITGFADSTIAIEDPENATEAKCAVDSNTKYVYIDGADTTIWKAEDVAVQSSHEVIDELKSDTYQVIIVASEDATKKVTTANVVFIFSEEQGPIGEWYDHDSNADVGTITKGNLIGEGTLTPTGLNSYKLTFDANTTPQAVGENDLGFDEDKYVVSLDFGEEMVGATVAQTTKDGKAVSNTIGTLTGDGIAAIQFAAGYKSATFTATLTTDEGTVVVTIVVDFTNITWQE